MKTLLAKILSLISLMAIIFILHSPLSFASDFSEPLPEVITYEPGEIVEELVIKTNTIINADSSVIIKKLLIVDGAETVEINVEVQTLEVIAQNKVVLVGEGNITDVVISSKDVAVNTTGNIKRLIINNQDARIVVKEGTKISKLEIPTGTKRTDLITNYAHAAHRFEDDGNSDGNYRDNDDQVVTLPTTDNQPPVDDKPPVEVNPIPGDDTPPPTIPPVTPPSGDNNTPPSTINTGVTITIGTITQGSIEGTKASGTIGGITYTAKDTGTAGNNITISHGNNGISNPLQVNVYEWSPNSVSIGLETNSNRIGPGPTQYEIVSTNNEVKQAVEGDANASSIVDVTVSGNGNDVASNGYLTLSGGTNGITEKLEMTITHGADVNGTITVNVNSNSYNVNVSAGDSTDNVASKIAIELNGQVANYIVTSLESNVIFASTIAGNVEDISVIFGSNN